MEISLDDTKLETALRRPHVNLGHPTRPSRIPTDGERFNERRFVDLCDVVDVRGNRYWWLVAVDQHTDYTVIASCTSHESQAVAKNIFKHWTWWAGPPTYWCATESGA